MKISIVGAGHVGLVTGACFADLGHAVIMVDNDAKRIASLKRLVMPYYEPGLEELVARGVREQRLRFTASIREGVLKSDIIFIAVGTPQKATGEADLAYVEHVARSIAEHLPGYRLIVEKSTVPVQTGKWIAHTIKTYLRRKQPFDVASNPEFLREGTAIQDIMKPDRVVLGVESQRAADLLTELYQPLGAPIVITDINSAELIKHASNSFLATKISFINAVAQLCERCGADVQQVAEGMGLDPRIGRSFLSAGAGWGGFCFAPGESAYVLNSPNVRVESFERLFRRFPIDATIRDVDIAMQPGSRLLSFDARSRRATITGIRCLTRRWYEGPFIRLQTSMGRAIRVTADHPVVVGDPETGRLSTCAAWLVTAGDYLVSPTALPALEPCRAIDLVAELERHPVAFTVRVRGISPAVQRAIQRHAKEIPSSMCADPSSILRARVVPWRVLTYLRDVKGVRLPSAAGLRLFSSRGRTTDIPARFRVDAAFMRWLGYYLAEGWISSEDGRHASGRERVGFSFGQREREYLDDLHHLLDRYGIRYQVVPIGRAVATVVSSRLLAWLFRDLLRCGANSNDKQLPGLAFNVSARLRRALLQGLFSGDGSISRLRHGRNLMFEYATTSKALADGVVLLLQSLGVVPSLQARWMNKSQRPVYRVRVSGLRQLRALRYLFGAMKRRRIETLLRRHTRDIAQRGFIRRAACVLLPVRKVEAVYDRSYVYSLETENQHLVAGNGLVMHNCFPKDVDAFIKIAEQLGYDFGLLKAVRDINDAQKRDFARKIQQALWVLNGKTIAVLGLAFKPNTDDMRYAPAIDVIEHLRAEGAAVRAFDPQAMREAARLLPGVAMCKDPYDAARGADCLAILTEWNEFKELDFTRIKKLLRQPLIVDGRNIYDPERMKALGFRYLAVGRGRIELDHLTGGQRVAFRRAGDHRGQGDSARTDGARGEAGRTDGARRAARRAAA